MIKPLPSEIILAGHQIFLFTREEDLLNEVEPDYAEFLAAFGAEINNFTQGRLRELYLGRSLVREGILDVLGADPGWIRTSADRRPELPAGVACSLSHTHLQGHRVAVVAVARIPEKVIGIDLEPRFTELQAEKLRERFAGYFDSASTLLDSENMTEFFTIYESCVKILSQKNRGIVSPSHLKLASKTPDSWVVLHPESGIRMEGITLNYRDAKLSIGLG